MKALLIGTGAAGNKALMELVNSNVISEDNAVFVNSTSMDIPKGAKKTVVLSHSNSGCGKERGMAKEYVLTAIKSEKLDLSKDVEGVDAVVIVTSLEGGTGSGSAPILAKYCNQMLGKNVHIIGFTGFEEDVRGLQNTIEFFQEIDDEITVQVIQNTAFLKEAKGNKFKAEELANKELVKRVRVMLGCGMIGSTQNIDSTDIYKVVNTAGYMTVEKTELESGLGDIDEFNTICKQMISRSKSIKSNNPGQIRLGVIMNLSELSAQVVDHHFEVLKKEYGNPYECFMHLQYNDDEPEYIAFVSSGMKLPIDEVKAIHKRYMEQSSAVDKKKDDFFSQISALKGNAEDNKFNMGSRGSSSNMTQDQFMKQFETKKK